MSNAETPVLPRIALTVAEASRVMRISRNTTYRMLARGELRAVRNGRLVFITAESIAQHYDILVTRVLELAAGI